ncbi:hypothetical protein [Paraburkholderia sp. 32]|uniref:hypothetical protein n=1 Tax=Paraburkholderia sp. 32 TaxID=2991057 RepID=UPI003D20FFE5
MNATSAMMLDAFRLGGDSLLVGLGVGFVVWHLHERFAWSIAFGACDGAASLLGAACLHHSIDIPDLAYIFLIVLMVPLVLRGKRWALWFAPLIFSFDNFFAYSPRDETVFLAVSSGLLAFVGMYGARALSRAVGVVVRKISSRRSMLLSKHRDA